jgi:antitoxin CcdA
MIEFKNTKVCDVCQTRYSENDYVEYPEFVHINMVCGYGTIFIDGATIQLDICQHCLKEKLGKYIRIIEEG